MGAHNFHDEQYGETAEEAFCDAVHQATYESGHNPYNGTISTNDSFIMVPLNEGESISDWVDRMTEHKDVRKWGPCGCVKDPDEKVSNKRWLWHFAGWAAS